MEKTNSVENQLEMFKNPSDSLFEEMMILNTKQVSSLVPWIYHIFNSKFNVKIQDVFDVDKLEEGYLTAQEAIDLAKIRTMMSVNAVCGKPVPVFFIYKNKENKECLSNIFLEYDISKKENRYSFSAITLCDGNAYIGVGEDRKQVEDPEIIQDCERMQDFIEKLNVNKTEMSSN